MSSAKRAAPPARTRESGTAPRVDWLARVRRGLREAADPARAPAMQAYMKSTMPYWGVGAADTRRVCKEVFREYPFASADAFREDVLSIWRGATHREERYAALELTGDRRARAFQSLEMLGLYEEIIVTGAWWDYVDVVASHRLGDLLSRSGAPIKKKMLAWSRDENLWKRRSAILCQLRKKSDTDLDLLYRAIEPSLGSKEFFLRKAIGWALRQLAWTSPDEVRRYVREHESVLSGLSKREALKNLGSTA